MLSFPNPSGIRPAPVPGSASTTYGPDSVTSRVSGGAGGGVLEEMLKKLIAKKSAGTPQQPRVGGLGKNTTVAAPQRITHTADIKENDGPSWQSVQGSAMGPVGLGPGMIPGMGVDPRKLPPSMRPQQASFQGPTHSVAQGGISPAEPDAPLTAQPEAGGEAVDPRMAVLTQMLRGLFQPAAAR